MNYEPKTGRQKQTLGPTIVETIAVLVGAPRESTKVVIVMDWNTQEFFADFDYLLTDGDGRPILTPIKTES